MKRALALLVLLAGCTDAAPGESAARRPDPAPGDALTGTEWDVAAIGARPVLERTFPTLTFAPPPPGDASGRGVVGGYDGCNGFTGRYRRDGDRFQAEDLTSELEGCLPAVSEQADAYASALARAVRVRLAGAEPALLDSAGTVALALRRHPERSVDAAALTRGRWRLVSIETLPPPPGPPMPPPRPVPPPPPPGGILVPRLPVPPSAPAPGGHADEPPPPPDPNVPAPEVVVSFGSDGTLSGTAGCRVLAGTYRLSGDDLSLPSFGVDDQACSPGERTRFVAYGLASGEVEVSDRQLVLHHRDGTRVVFARP